MAFIILNKWIGSCSLKTSWNGNLQIFQVISEKNKHLNQFNILCNKWTEVMWLSHYLDLITKVLKWWGDGVYGRWCSDGDGTSKKNIVFGLGSKASKSNSSPMWPRCLQSAKPFVRRIILPTLTVWWSPSPPTSCQKPQMIDPREHQPQKKHFFFFWTNLRKLILWTVAVAFTINQLKVPWEAIYAVVAWFARNRRNIWAFRRVWW